MTSGPEHYAEAERLLALADEKINTPGNLLATQKTDAGLLLSAANAHAALAQTAAIVEQFASRSPLVIREPGDVPSNWIEVTSCQHSGCAPANAADMSGTEGQDRESYADDQDRESYT